MKYRAATYQTVHGTLSNFRTASCLRQPRFAASPGVEQRRHYPQYVAETQVCFDFLGRL